MLRIGRLLAAREAEPLALDNAVLLPHVASGTDETRRAIAAPVLESLRSFFRDGAPKVAVPVH